MTSNQRDTVFSLRRDSSLSPAERDRVETVLLSEKGWSPPAIASHLGYCNAQVRRILKQFTKEGVSGLHHKLPGPEPDTDRRNQVHAALKSLLVQDRTWTSFQLSDALKEHGIDLSARQVRRYLHGMDARYKRVARTLQHKQDPDKVAAAKQELSVLKKRLPLAS